MQRKPGFPVANCAIKMPESGNSSTLEPVHGEDDVEQQQRRQQLINFGHIHWGFKNWSWSVTKQELDFVDFTNGKYCVGVVAYVSITVKTIGIHRENIGYATSLASSKGFAIYKSRKCAVTNALRETLLSFGGNVASELMECLEARAGCRPADVPAASPPAPPPPAPAPPAPKPEPKASPPARVRMEPEAAARAPHGAPPVATAHPLPPRAPPPRPPSAPAPLRPNSNVSFVLQPVMPPLYAPPRLPPAPPMFPNAYYECSGPWHFYESYDRAHGNVNLNFNIPPKSLVVNGRNGSVECKNVCRADGELPFGPQQAQGCWIKPTIFYDGFWTEQKVKKWVAEQVEKQLPEDPSHEPAPLGHDAKA